MGIPSGPIKRVGLTATLVFLAAIVFSSVTGKVRAQTDSGGMERLVSVASVDFYKPCLELGTQNSEGYAAVERRGHIVTIAAHGATPLGPTLAAVRERYGWTVDFEEPVFTSAFDLCELWIYAGIYKIPFTSFSTSYYETKNVRLSTAAEERILRKIVSDYNRGENPGKFVVRNEGRGRFAVVGESVKDDQGKPENVTPISDTRITIPRERRKVYKAIVLIVQELGYSQSIDTVESDTAAFPPNANLESLVGGTDLPASELLAQAANAGGKKISWILRWYGGQDGATASVILEFSPHVALAGKVLNEKAPLLTYENKRYGLSFRYPRGYVLSKGAQGEYTAWGSGTDPNWVGLVTIKLPQAAYTDSNLDSAYVSFGANAHITQKDCEELLGSSEKATSTIRINGIPFFTAPPTGGIEGGGTLSRSTYYTTFQNGICHEIYMEERISTPGLYELGGVVLPVDYDDLHNRLHSIVSAVKIRPSEASH
jgi:hypothetical protein